MISWAAGLHRRLGGLSGEVCAPGRGSARSSRRRRQPRRDRDGLPGRAERRPDRLPRGREPRSTTTGAPTPGRSAGSGCDSTTRRAGARPREYKVPRGLAGGVEISRTRPRSRPDEGGPGTGRAPGDVDLAGTSTTRSSRSPDRRGPSVATTTSRSAVEPAVERRPSTSSSTLGRAAATGHRQLHGLPRCGRQERIDHTANAVIGSSGGLLLDGDYALVGLHQGAHGSTCRQHRDLGDRDPGRRPGPRARTCSTRDTCRRPGWLDDSRPILGRVKCQEWVRRTAKPLDPRQAADREPGRQLHARDHAGVPARGRARDPCACRCSSSTPTR